MLAEWVFAESNIALRRPSRISSSKNGGTADKANDGNINGIFKRGSCPHNDDSLKPWWAVDLESERLVLSVHIYNRVDVPSQLHDLLLGLKDTWPTNKGSTLVAMDAMCGTLVGPQRDARLMIQCEKNAVGRYLVIQSDGLSALTMCEVEVFGVQTAERNIALGRPSSQSSTASGRSADRANDGNTDGVYTNGSCSQTDTSSHAWWAVDLDHERLVLSVHIYNIIDGALEKLSDVRVGLKDTWPTNNGSTLIAMDAMCGTRDGPHPEARLTIRCEKNAVGRYLVIQITRYPLALCEVLVLVDPHTSRKSQHGRCTRGRQHGRCARRIQHGRYTRRAQEAATPDGLNTADSTNVLNTADTPDGLITPDAPDGLNRADAPEGHNTEDAPDGLNTADAPDGLNTADAPDGLNMPDAPDGFNTADAPEEHITVDAPDRFNTANAPHGLNTADTPDGFNTADAPDGHSMADAPDGFNTADAPEGLNTADAPDGLKAAATSGGLNTADAPDGYNMADTPRRTLHCRYTTTDTTLQIHHDGHYTADTPRRTKQGRYNTTDKTRQIHHDGHYTADTPRRTKHGRYTTTDITMHIPHDGHYTAGTPRRTLQCRYTTTGKTLQIHHDEQNTADSPGAYNTEDTYVDVLKSS
ncbi:hypothetical protein NP493_816g02034 [Ridgeia piscesae]|uniref:Fucolectin tachylectin-4 pentraxin-1 domain-containing protein n=1 Tax=Ridgeia piscesae TaxID=27915 RepID=A0AAD9NLC0_RIDPI|nr:hypothetical protein NP493_816g02034 [Ridgeia piscesae]